MKILKYWYWRYLKWQMETNAHLELQESLECRMYFGATIDKYQKSERYCNMQMLKYSNKLK